MLERPLNVQSTRESVLFRPICSHCLGPASKEAPGFQPAFTEEDLGPEFAAQHCLLYSSQSVLLLEGRLTQPRVWQDAYEKSIQCVADCSTNNTRLSFSIHAIHIRVLPCRMHTT